MERYKRKYDENIFMGETMSMLEMVLHPDNYVNLIKDKIISFYNKNIFTDINDLIVSLNSYLIDEKIQFKLSDKKLSKYDSGLQSARYYPKANVIVILYTDDILNAFKMRGQTNDYSDFKWFLEDFEEFLGHETIHRMQSFKDKVNNIKATSTENEKEHYSQTKEIMSYAWQIVQTFKMYGKDEDYIKFILSSKRDEPNVKVINFIPVFKKYYNLFDKDSNVMKLLYKYIYLYIDNK